MALERGVPAEVIAELGGHFHPARLFELEWHGGTIRMHTGFGDIEWDGDTYSGAQVTVDGHSITLAQFEAPAEAYGDLSADGGTLKIVTTPEGMMNEFGQNVRNNIFTAYSAITTEPGGNVLIGEPFDPWTGYVDGRSFSLRSNGINRVHDMTLSIAVGPVPRTRASMTHSYEDQITAYPGDTAGRHLQHMRKNTVNPPKWPGD